MRYVCLRADGLLVETTADDPDALVLFTASEACDVVLRRDRVTEEMVDLINDARAQGNDPAVARHLGSILMGRERNPMKQERTDECVRLSEPYV